MGTNPALALQLAARNLVIYSSVTVIDRLTTAIPSEGLGRGTVGGGGEVGVRLERRHQRRGEGRDCSLAGFKNRRTKYTERNRKQAPECRCFHDRKLRCLLGH